MLEFGRFDGVGRRDYLCAVAVYGFDAWAGITGSKDMEEYKDFLLEQERFLQKEAGDALVVRVPFDAREYREWLLQNRHWEDGPEARGAWALAVAENPAKLEVLLSRCPAFPASPEDEEMADVYLFGVHVVLDKADDAKALASPLSGAGAVKLAVALRECYPWIHPYRKVSRLRARGGRVLVGDRLVLEPDYYTVDVEGFLEDAAPAAKSEVISLPREFRIRAKDVVEQAPGFPARLCVYLPVVFHGDAAVLEFWYGHLRNKALSFGKVRQALMELLADAGLHVEELEDLFPAWAAGTDFDFECGDGDDEQDGAVIDGKPHLHRVK